MTAQTGFHDGELAVQDRAGVRVQAARLGEAMLATPDLNGGMGAFLAARDFAVLTGRDADGRLWTSPLFSSTGFLQAHDRELKVHALPSPGDPLHDLAVQQPIGLLAIEFATRRRVRVNGTLVHVGEASLLLSVEQAYGNCPKYIHPRHLEHYDTPAPAIERSPALSPEHVQLVTNADTFFLGTIHPSRGADASHRGGPPGFVRVEGNRLWWPDYPGNNMFNSFGNLAVDPSAALLFIDFDTGTTLHISGTATVEWVTPSDIDGGTGRRVSLTVESVVWGARW
ncbi:pyridoxamine 5'-phosphate oxidase family protein [Mycobacterium sp. 29Ha]|uniref:pyridoxamine 5'-phosphate oxidase family protein n=1 Tax=Mycobacterium sp. 29Ha TaxID=2939268 RepID=UPI002938F918|nr:pyridoxamine 5'-phosphate oxidase family protein [Mycobacterium sp. 29Ha]MDV3132403.1 pyridoxamine 5'-phosphate oxidase family protein [Mycobacterium sp. 29Ha]